MTDEGSVASATADAGAGPAGAAMPPRAGRRVGPRGASLIRSGWLAALVAAAPAVLSGLRAVTGRWAPVIDNGVISVKASDAWAGHPPLVGIYTSLSSAAHWPHHLYHPGPAEFWAMAPMQRLFGPSGIGLAIGAALLDAVAAGGTVWLVRKFGGPWFAWVAAALVAVMCWSLGGQVLHDPWNPHLAVLPGLFVLAAAWRVASGDVRMLPVLAVAASVVAQLHLTFVLPAVAVSAVAVAALVRSARVRSAAGGVRWRWPVVTTAVLVLAVWSGPVIDQIHGRGNLVGLLRASGASPTQLGAGAALRGLVHATSVPPVWWSGVDDLVHPQPGVSAIDVATAVLVWLVLATLFVRAWRARRRSIVVGLAVAVTGLLAATVTVARTPGEFGYQELLWARRVWWPMAVFPWIVAAAAIGAELAARPSNARTSLRAGRMAAAVAAVAAVVVVAATWPRLGVAHDFGSAGFGPVRHLGAAAVRATDRGEPWVVERRGEFAYYVVGPGVVARLVAAGRDVRVAPAANLDLGSHHDLPHGARGTVIVASGPDAADVPPGFHQVARWDQSTAGSPFDSYRRTMFVIPVEPVAVFVRDPGR
ncbi:MAG TPA: hypothetical protein VHA73_07840 [Acidimicrobiales bacterium]|nr:hypothetical protein [Acidimicrobiales bacterium]